MISIAVDQWGSPIHIRHNKLIIVKGALKVTRLGNLNPRDQSMGEYSDRAPERKGIWAFPFPYFDMFFAYHKYTEVLPKHLLDMSVEDSVAWWEYLDENPELSKEWVNYRNALATEKKEWIKNNRDSMPLRHFFWRGDVYTRFDRWGRQNLTLVGLLITWKYFYHQSVER